MKKKIVKKVLDDYASLKIDGDYFLNFESEKMIVNSETGMGSVHKMDKSPTSTNIYEGELEKIPFGFRVNKQFINRIHPDKININYFWQYAVEKFPFFAISNYQNCKSKDDVNQSNMFAHRTMGTTEVINTVFEDNEKAKILEIGPGYGNIMKYIRNSYSDEKYFAIDVNPLFNHDRIFRCDGKTVSTEVGANFDLVYSVNVFQHLSKKQRSSYYREIYKKLKNGGRFIFTMFVVHPQNENIAPMWGVIDENGRRYCHMFSQLTEIDTFEEIHKELTKIGFKYNFKLMQNMGIFTCTKIKNHDTNKNDIKRNNRQSK